MNYENEIKELRAKLDSLEKAMNKPTIEVGKWYKEVGRSYLCGLWMPLALGDVLESSFGFGTYGGDFCDKQWRGQSKNIILADDKEVLEALTKHADKLYEGVEKVDRSGFTDVRFPAATLCEPGRTYYDEKDGFMYKGIFVMDENGKWATPVVEDWDVKITEGRTIKFNTLKPLELGTYKLVKI